MVIILIRQHYDSCFIEPFNRYKTGNEVLNVLLRHGSHNSKGLTEKVKDSLK